MAWLAGCGRNRFERSERGLWPSFSRRVSKDALRDAPRDLIEVSLGMEEKGSGVLCNPETRQNRRKTQQGSRFTKGSYYLVLLEAWWVWPLPSWDCSLRPGCPKKICRKTAIEIQVLSYTLAHRTQKSSDVDLLRVSEVQMGLPIGLFFPLSCMSESVSHGLPNQECRVPVPSDVQIKYIHDLRFTRPRQPGHGRELQRKRRPIPPKLHSHPATLETRPLMSAKENLWRTAKSSVPG